jgi:hypothetical protein
MPSNQYHKLTDRGNLWSLHMKFPSQFFLTLALLSSSIGYAQPAAVSTATLPAVEQLVEGENSTVLIKTNGVFTYKSPFDAPTSVKLTAIVARARDSIATFDKIRDDTYQLVNMAVGKSKRSKQMAAATAAIEKVRQLQPPVTLAKAEMVVAKAELIASKRYYSETVLSGMELFIATVDSELADEVAGLTAKLTKKK